MSSLVNLSEPGLQHIENTVHGYTHGIKEKIELLSHREKDNAKREKSIRIEMKNIRLQVRNVQTDLTSFQQKASSAEKQLQCMSFFSFCFVILKFICTCMF